MFRKPENVPKIFPKIGYRKCFFREFFISSFFFTTRQFRESASFTVFFREGRHTGANIAGHIDKVVGAIPGLKGSTTRFCVTDNAANMLSAVPRQTKKIDKGLGCFDHLLNLAMKDTNKADETIAGAIKVIFVKFVIFETLVVLYRYFR